VNADLFELDRLSIRWLSHLGDSASVAMSPIERYVARNA
jgi:hypothetical protein